MSRENHIYFREGKQGGGHLECILQDGPIKEVGINGCQIDDIIEWAKARIEFFNSKFPCRENSMIITKLDEALLWSTLGLLLSQAAAKEERRQDIARRGADEGLTIDSRIWSV